MIDVKKFLTDLKKSGIEKDLQRLAGFDKNNYNLLVDIIRSSKNKMYQSEVPDRIKELNFDKKSEKQFLSIIKKSQGLT